MSGFLRTIALAALVTAFCDSAFSQTQDQPLLLTIEVANYVTYRGDVTDSTKLARDPGVTSPLPAELYTSGGAYREAGRYTEAETVLRQSLTIRRGALGPGHLDTARGMSRLGAVLFETGRYAEAEALFREALEVREKALAPEDPELAGSLSDLAEAPRAGGKLELALPLSRRAVFLLAKTAGPNDPKLAPALNNFGETLRPPQSIHWETGMREAQTLAAAGNYVSAEQKLQELLRLAEQIGDPPAVMVTVNSICVVSLHLRRIGQAESYCRRGLALTETLLGTTHPATAIALNNLAGAYEDLLQLSKAKPLYLRALAIHTQMSGPAHPETIKVLNNLGQLYFHQRKLPEAEFYYRKALAAWDQSGAKFVPERALTLDNLAVLLRAQGHRSDAVALCEEALTQLEAALGKEHPALVASLSNLATAYLEQKDYARAEPLFRRALSIMGPGTEDPFAPRILGNYARLARRTGRRAMAKELEKRGKEIAARVSEKRQTRYMIDVTTLNSVR